MFRTTSDISLYNYQRSKVPVASLNTTPFSTKQRQPLKQEGVCFVGISPTHLDDEKKIRIDKRFEDLVSRQMLKINHKDYLLLF